MNDVYIATTCKTFLSPFFVISKRNYVTHKGVC